MKLLYRTWFECLFLILLTIFNWFILANAAYVPREIYTVLFLFILPGILIARMLQISTKNGWYFFIVSCGLSITFMYGSGLLANFLLPVFLKVKPLETFPFLYLFDALLILFAIISSLLSHKSTFSPKLLLPTNTNLIFILLSSCLPILSILGSTMLNNGASNILIIMLLCMIPLLLTCLVMLQSKLSESTYCWYIFMASVSLLLMLSLRSWHILGSDINDEYGIFHLTKTQGFWNYSFKHAYNACLSITILPTIISNLTHINDEYIYKFVIQVLFALTPVGLYTLYKNFANKILSLLAVFYVIAQPFFIQPMTGIIRQEVAFFFFILTLNAAFGAELKKGLANVLFIIFGIALVLSHYSTAYISVILFTLSFICITVFNTFKNHTLVRKIYTSIGSLRFNIHITHSIQALPLLILIIVTYFWYFQFTQTSGNLVSTLTSSITHFGDIFSSKKQTSEQSAMVLSFSAGGQKGNIQNIQKYTTEITKEFSKSKVPMYSATSSNLYPINDLSLSSQVNAKITSLLNIFLNIIRNITKAIIFLSPLLLVIKYMHKNIRDKEYIIFTIIGLGLVILTIFHPGLGDAYNVSRIYLQILMIAAISGIVFLFDIQFFIAPYVRLCVMCFIFICMFTLHSGLSEELLGGVSYAHLNNFGSDYDKFYVHQQEVAGAQWLTKNYNLISPVYVDTVSGSRMDTYSQIQNVIPLIVPSAMYKDSYVYAGYSNIIRKRTEAYDFGTEIVYSYPIDFLHKNKNLIYNNGGTQIYK